MENSFTVKLEDDGNGDLFMPIPAELLEHLEWDEGDTIEFVEDDYSDAFYIRKVNWNFASETW